MRQSVTRVLPYAAEDLFNLVADVERYPEFVPWVTAMRVWNARGYEDSLRIFDAEARVRFAFVRERFSTRVSLNQKSLTIDTTLISGPFRRLENHWRFGPDGGGSRVNFDIDFEFGSRLLEGLLAANASRAAAKLMSCFEARARVLYG